MTVLDSVDIRRQFSFLDISGSHLVEIQQRHCGAQWSRVALQITTVWWWEARGAAVPHAGWCKSTARGPRCHHTRPESFSRGNVLCNETQRGAAWLVAPPLANITLDWLLQHSYPAWLPRDPPALEVLVLLSLTRWERLVMVTVINLLSSVYSVQCWAWPGQYLPLWVVAVNVFT